VSKQEGDYWDFKRCHHTNTADLLHDIICMSNNLADRDAYIIFGVIDKTGEVVGVEQDKNRRTQQELVQQLKGKGFASDIRPNIELVTLTVQGHAIDVLIVKNSIHTPYFLTRNHPDNKQVVRANYIYTRICDTNTDIDKSADINQVEYLWRKRFGIDKPIYERYQILLGNPNDWVVDWGNRDYAYNRYSPEFQMKCGDITDSKGSWEPCAAFFLDSEMFFTKLELFYHSTVVYETELWAFDGLRSFVPKASNGMAGNHGTLWYFYYDLSSIEGKLLRIFTDERYDYSSREHRCVQFLLFENEESKERFNLYFLQHKDDFPDSTLEQEFEHEISTEEREGHHRAFSAIHVARAYKVYQQWTDEGLNPIRMAHQPAH
jgi:hypothetical protein